VFGSGANTTFLRNATSIPKTQMEASRSSGLTAFQAVSRVILPQALLRTTPIFSNQFIAIIKDTSVAMTIGYAELTYQTQWIESLTFRGFEAAIIATLLYIALACLVIVGMHQVDRLLRVNVRKG
jgi:polar amino acid transport system permease protein